MSWRAYLDRQDYAQRARLLLVRDGAPGYSYKGVGPPHTVAPLQFVEREEGFTLNDGDWTHTFSFDDYRDFLQAMADLAWEHDVKPRGLADDTRAMEVQRYHLEDMRKLVLKDRA